MVDIDEIKNIFAQLVEIDSPSLDERRMADYIIELFSKIGVELIEDDSRDVTKSSAGNLHGYVKGNGKAPLLLAAHMDTVMPAYNKKAVFIALIPSSGANPACAAFPIIFASKDRIVGAA